MRVLMGVLLMLRIKVVLFCEEVIVSELDDMFCVFMRTVVVIRAREQLTDSVHRYDWPNPRRPDWRHGEALRLTFSLLCGAKSPDALRCMSCGCTSTLRAPRSCL